jgi:hypothetical protein
MSASKPNRNSEHESKEAREKSHTFEAMSNRFVRRSLLIATMFCLLLFVSIKRSMHEKSHDYLIIGIREKTKKKRKSMASFIILTLKCNINT